MDAWYDFVIRSWNNNRYTMRTFGGTNVSHVDGNLKYQIILIDEISISSSWLLTYAGGY